jgi:large subunit ribosomal protein L25
MAEIIKLTATPRAEQGTRPSRRLRAEGKIPGVIYGMGSDPRPVTVNWRELRAALVTEQGLNAVIHLDLEGDSNPTLVKDMQRHPVRRDVLHVDFLRVDLDKEVEFEVQIVLEGEALKVTQADGMVEQTLNALLISAKPDSIPPQIAVDISGLEIGDAIRVGDLDLPAGVETLVDPEEPIVSGQHGITAEDLETDAVAEVPEGAEEAEGADADEAAEDGEGGGEGGEADAAEGESA